MPQFCEIFYESLCSRLTNFEAFLDSFTCCGLIPNWQSDLLTEKVTQEWWWWDHISKLLMRIRFVALRLTHAHRKLPWHLLCASTLHIVCDGALVETQSTMQLQCALCWSKAWAQSEKVLSSIGVKLHRNIWSFYLGLSLRLNCF